MWKRLMYTGMVHFKVGQGTVQLLINLICSNFECRDRTFGAFHDQEKKTHLTQTTSLPVSSNLAGKGPASRTTLLQGLGVEAIEGLQTHLDWPPSLNCVMTLPSIALHSYLFLFHCPLQRNPCGLLQCRGATLYSTTYFKIFINFIYLFPVFQVMWWRHSGQRRYVPGPQRTSIQRVSLQEQAISLSTLQYHALSYISWTIKGTKTLQRHLQSQHMHVCYTSQLLPVFTLPQDVL